MIDPWPLFEAALEGHPFVTVDSLKADLAAGRGAVWRGERSAVFVSKDGAVCEAAPAGGDLSEIIECGRPEIEAWARANDCTEMHIQAGREGWARALAPFGYEVAAVILRKKL